MKNYKKELEKRGVFTKTDLCYVFPYRYCNYTIPVIPTPFLDGQYIAVYGMLTSVDIKKVNYRSFINARMETPYGLFRFTYFGNKPMESIVENLIDKNIIVGGKLKYDEKYGPSISNPDVLTEQYPGWHLQYGVMGIHDDMLRNMIQDALQTVQLPETIPERYLQKTGFLHRKEALCELAAPTSPTKLLCAMQRQVFEDLLYFACGMERSKRKLSPGSQYNVKTCKTSEAIIQSLPYALTTDQMHVYHTLINDMKNGIRLSYLVQGDVGCGKSITAFLLMFAIADSGWQSVIMAPTMILAEQHYQELSLLGEKYGYEVAFLHGGLKAAERKKILKGIENGRYRLIVSTHAATSKSVLFHNLALVIIDEEQRFGVKQRQMLREKATQGVHSVSMTATPIPRTIATSIYGDTKVLSIKTMPAGRKPVQTAICQNDWSVIPFLKQKLDEGGQAYIICPLIEDKNDSNKQTVKDVAARYQSYLQMPVGIVTGKQTKKEASAILESFRTGATRVLIGTTILEVGVSVKNANVIIIEDAWVFGLSQLHQLRGRVARGSKEGFCILISDRKSDGLSLFASTTDGFTIAEYDRMFRGDGNVLGNEQSGMNRYITEAELYPNMYKYAVTVAKEMTDTGEDEILIQETESRSEKNYLNIEKLQVYDYSGISWNTSLPKMMKGNKK